MKALILRAMPAADGMVRLTGGDYRHLALARRLAPGDFFPARLPDGTDARALVVSLGSGELACRVEPAERSEEGAAALPPVILMQALLKGEKMDLVVRQAAECGAAEILPFEADFSQVRLGSLSQAKPDRWRRIAREARQQSGSRAATRVAEPVSAAGLFARWDEIRAAQPTALGALFHCPPIPGAALHERLAENPGAVALAIGPEGGFSPAETERFIAAGFAPFTLGDTVLRTETAALYAQAAIRMILWERGSWKTR